MPVNLSGVSCGEVEMSTVKSGRCEILVDADIVAFQSAVVCDTEIDWEDESDDVCVTTDLTVDIKANMLNRIESIKQKVLSHHKNLRSNDIEITCCFTGKDNWRKQVYPSYKSNRKDKAKPTRLDEAVEILMNAFDHHLVTNFEADDLLGMLQSSSFHTTIIASIDKDLLQIDGWHYNWKRDEHTYVSNGWKQHLIQWLAGDTVDGYSGVARIGVKKATKLLKDIDNYTDGIQFCKDFYELKGYSPEYTQQMAQVSFIMNDADLYINDEGKPVLPVF